MSVNRPVPAVVCVLILGLSSSPGIGSEPTESRSPLEMARSRLSDAHEALVSGVLTLEAEQKKLIGTDSGALVLLGTYRTRFQRELATIGALEREFRTVQAIRDTERISSLSHRVNRVHLAALKLSSRFDSHGIARLRELEGKMLDVGLAPIGASSCYGSIAGTVQGPIGPRDGILVTAYTGDEITAGFALTEGDGRYQIDDLLAGEDYYLVTSNADAYIDEVFDDVVCPGGSCDPSIGSPVSVSGGMITPDIDFVLAAGGRIGGALSSQPGPLPLPLTTVNIFDAAGGLVTSVISDFTGTYLTEAGLPSGSYRVVTANLFGSLDELYDNIPCPAGVGCAPASGTPIAVTAPSITSGIDLELSVGGNITGNITVSGTSLPIANILVGVHDGAGLLIAFGASDAAGNYSILSGLPTGDFFAATGNLEGYMDELFDDLPCSGGLCTITSGTEIPVTLGVTTPNIDFALSSGGTFSGRVTRATDGAPLGDVFVLGHTDSGDLVGTATTDANGDYTLLNGLGTGSYRATTLNPVGWDDELFNNLPCPGGGCDVTVGSPIAVTLGLDTANIDFELSGDAITSCDFEGCSTCGFKLVP